jgi:glycosidase
LEHYKQLISWRKQYSALRNGSFRFLFFTTGNHAVAFERRDEQQTFVVILNAGESAAELNFSCEAGSYESLASGQVYASKRGKLTLQLQPFEYLLLRKLD